MAIDLYSLAERMGCPIAERSSAHSYLFDGKTIANHTSSLNYNDDGDPVMPFFGKRIELLSYDLWHEIMHYVVADPEQRDLPEYGLAFGIADTRALGPLGGPYRDKNGDLLLGFDKWWEGVVDRHIQDAQEFAVWMIDRHFIHDGVMTCESALTKMWSSWECAFEDRDQRLSKVRKDIREDAQKRAWQAIQKLEAIPIQ